jgi:hypothetical protein
MRHADALALIDRQLRRARAALRIERVTAAAAPLAAAGLVWAGLAVAGAFETLGPYSEALAACIFWLGAAFLAWRAWRRHKPITAEETRQRLARDSNLDAATFDALDDQPSRLDPVALALWKHAQGDARARAASARAKGPRPDWSWIDPYRARFVLPVLLAAALGWGWWTAGPQPMVDRLARSVGPDPGVLAGDLPMMIEAWAQPADYTGAAAVALSDRLGQTVETPPSVEAVVRVTGPKGPPDLVFEGAAGRQSAAFTIAGDGAYEARLKIPEGGRLSIVRFHTKARWTITPAADAAPTIAFNKPPPVRPAKRIAFSWTATDDYGVNDVFLRVRPLQPPPGLIGAKAIDTALTAPGGAPRDAEGAADLLLYEHPYAGMEVEARLVARDALGQEGLSPPERMTLPEKPFTQTMALAAIEIRKLILYERRGYAPAPLLPGLAFERPVDDGGLTPEPNRPNLLRAPRAIQRAARLIDSVTMLPDRATFPDTALWTGFQYARAALSRAGSIEETTEAADRLWQVALMAEYGDSADARTTLEAARQRVADALKRGASPEEMAQLMADLRAAMRDYLDHLTAEALAQGRTAQNQDDTTEDRPPLQQSDLDRILEDMQRMADAGDLNAAERLLQQLSQMLDNLSVQLGEGPGLQQSETRGTEAQPDLQAKGLNDAIGSQRALRDETAREGEQGGENGEGQGGQDGAGRDGQGGQQSEGQGQSQGQGQGRSGRSAMELAERQGALADEIARQQKGLREGSGAGRALREAERAMRNAEGALRDGNTETAGAAQDEALRRLRQSLERLGLEREGGRGQAGRQGGPRDPLGRAVGGSGEGEETAVPEEMDRQRAREILDDVRRRAQDPRRPEAERDYLRRLLERFANDSGS